LLCFSALLICGSASAGSQDEGSSTSTLQVQGNATLDKPADQLELTFSVVTQEKTAAAAAAQNASSMTRVQAALRKAGIAKKEIATLSYRIDPIYSRRPKLPSGSEWHPSIEAYKASNRIRVTAADLSRAGEWIDVAIAAGANSIDSIAFGLKDAHLYRDEVIRAATAHAIADAQSLADAASLRLVGILEIILNPGQSNTPMPRRQMRASFADAEMTPIAPGAVTVQATVGLIYEIESRN
jgi:hypothetical protein